jgi:hypothetical protein
LARGGSGHCRCRGAIPGRPRVRDYLVGQVRQDWNERLGVGPRWPW